MAAKLPQNLILDLTSRCNLSCFMCNVHCRPGVKEDLMTMPDSVFEKVLPLAGGLGRLTLGGNGEPFLDPAVFDRLRRIRERGPAVAIDVFTNGTLLHTAARAQQAVALVDRFQFSVNAFTPETYASIMRGADFARLRENLALFREARAASGRAIHAVAECIVMKRNLSGLSLGVDFCREFGLDALWLKPLWIIDGETEKEFVPPGDEACCEELRAQVRRAEEAGRACGVWVGVADEIRALYADKAGDGREEEGSPVSPVPSGGRPPRRPGGFSLARWWKFAGDILPEGSSCLDPWTTAQVFENGNVFLCCQEVTLVGNLHRQDFASIWNGRETRRYRRGLAAGQPYGACRTCPRIAPAKVDSYHKPFFTLELE